MGLKSELEDEVWNIYRERWTRRDGQKVPEQSSIGLGCDGVDLDAVILYADLSESTKLVDNHKDWFAAEVYKAYLRCSARIIRSEGGTITAYDGDRIMAVFLGDSKNSTAARVGLKINWASKNIVQKKLEEYYGDRTTYILKQVVGIDASKVLVARAGIRGSNDLVWIGRSANYAAKLCSLNHNYTTWITHRVYDNLHKNSKIGSDGRNMWEERVWKDMGDLRIYRSSWWWSFE